MASAIAALILVPALFYLTYLLLSAVASAQAILPLLMTIAMFVYWHRKRRARH
jgi:hypothetical protein